MIENNLDVFRNAVNNVGITEGLKNAGEMLLPIIKEDTPKQTGALAESITAEVVGDSLIIGSDKDYALEIHENAMLQHKNGESHFISNPIYEHIDDINQIIANGIKKNI